MKAKIIILTPVYKDWKNLNKLLSKINRLFLYKIKQKFDLIIIDDYSLEKYEIKKSKFKQIKRLKVLRNPKNLGSQRSIALGIKFIKNFYKKNFNLIVIDSDGQDNPNGILKLMNKFKSKSTSVVAKRGQRKESLWFKTCYEIYCSLIFFLAFKQIRFGNFSLLRSKDMNDVLKNENIWGAFPPTLSLSLKRLSFITIDRERRYSGISKMNFWGLTYHALRVFSVLRNRILIFSLIYIFIFFIIIPKSIFIVISIPIVLLNFSNFILALSNKKNFKEYYNRLIISD